MPDDQLSLRQIIVSLSALIYWGGVAIKAFLVRRHIGRSPNLKPKNFKEKLLWAGWFFFIAGWAGQPLIMNQVQDTALFSLATVPAGTAGLLGGVLFALSGYAGTLWCYSAMGTSWRIGVNSREKTALIQNGPYALVRHPIYLFQAIIFLGMIFLLPTLFSLVLFSVLIISAFIKTGDEEKYLMESHGEEYKNYSLRTGRFLPRWKTPLSS